MTLFKDDFSGFQRLHENFRTPEQETFFLIVTCPGSSIGSIIQMNDEQHSMNIRYYCDRSDIDFPGPDNGGPGVSPKGITGNEAQAGVIG